MSEPSEFQDGDPFLPVNWHGESGEMGDSYVQVKRTIGALASAVRSGESWSEQLQTEYDEGLRHLDAMYATREVPSDD